MPDTLAALLQHQRLSAHVFYSGTLCVSERFAGQGNHGHLHLVRRGPVRVWSPSDGALYIDEPSLLLYPRPYAHDLVVEPSLGAELLCATLDLGSDRGSPLARALPKRIVIALAGVPALSTTLTLLFEEAFGQACGRQAALDRLCELLIIQLLRQLLQAQPTQEGLLAGLADPKLARALMAMHEAPQRGFGLNELAALSGMSRARFAAHFGKVVGMPPLQYLAAFRMNVACTLLDRGSAIATVADEVGYSSTTAFARAFRTHVGVTPSEWQKRDTTAAPIAPQPLLAHGLG